jgi:L-fuconolactonase
VASDVEAAGVTGTVLVQAADTYEDTFYMLSVAASVPVVRGVVAWAPLDRAAEAEAALDRYVTSPLVSGIRVLNHNYDDPRWLLRPGGAGRCGAARSAWPDARRGQRGARPPGHAG